MNTGLAQCVLAPGDNPQLAALTLTPDAIFWCLAKRGAPVLSLLLEDVVALMVNDEGGIRIVYRPKDFPDPLRGRNPDGELEADFVLGNVNPAEARLREDVLLYADSWARRRAAGEVLATGQGYLEGIGANDPWSVERVDARERAIIFEIRNNPPGVFGYDSMSWFRIAPIPMRLDAARTLNLSEDEPVVLMSFDQGGVEAGSLFVRSTDLERWRVILEHFGVRDADSPP